MSEQAQPRELLELIQLVSLGLRSGDISEQGNMEYIEIRRWKGSDNELDEQATAIFRDLLVQQVNGFGGDEVAAAALELLGAANSHPRGDE